IGIVGTAIVALAMLLHVPVMFLLLQVLASLPTIREPHTALRHRRPRTAILIPAHNESASIASAVAAVRPELMEFDRVVIVADNCSDDTARRAIQGGAEVTERNDPQRLGKGYALDHGIRFLEQSTPPEVVLFLDADCELAPG